MIDSAPNIMGRPGLRLSERGPAGVEYASASGRFCKPLPGIPAHARHGTRWSSGPRSPHIPWDEDVFGAGSTFSTCVPALSASLQCPTSMGCRRQSRPERMPSKLATPASQWCGVHHVRSTSPGTLIGFQEGTRRTELDCANGLTVTSLIHPSLEGPHDYELRSMRTLVSVSRAVISQAY
ncbi:hypothetical protein L226DRAFT_311939 [Lentinus tigrinus ALCF2SS1-7]|uniref:uncharacterized protein n=1 Tax=Lentinus tigrinus ALCF2SS1-7 TaxID=1328758 RepID=UPI001166307C|nr:hypothetical protein L226DRAFT_311939 [Lentinus tigrinus ALCF2SS1-7]